MLAPFERLILNTSNISFQFLGPVINTIEHLRTPYELRVLKLSDVFKPPVGGINQLLVFRRIASDTIPCPINFKRLDRDADRSGLAAVFHSGHISQALEYQERISYEHVAGIERSK